MDAGLFPLPGSCFRPPTGLSILLRTFQTWLRNMNRIPFRHKLPSTGTCPPPKRAIAVITTVVVLASLS